MKMKKLIILLIFIIPFFCISGYSTWVVVNEIKITPKYNPNSIFYSYLNNQEVVYNGTAQGPVNDILDLTDSSIKIKYRLTTETDYINGFPTNSGKYYIHISSNSDDYGSNNATEVLFTINKAMPTCDVLPILSDSFEGVSPTIQNEDDLIHKGVNNNILNGNISVDLDTVVYPVDSTNSSETITADVLFTPTDTTNYQECVYKVNLVLHAVAYIKSSQSKYFGSLQKAINVASSGDNIYVIPGNVLNVSENITIKSGVNLYVPYENETYYPSDTVIKSELGNSFSDSSQSNVAKYRVTLINLINGSDLYIESGASLYLGGEFKSIGISRYYNEINLNENSSIYVSGEFYCYGYVKEDYNTAKNSSQSNYINILDNSYDEGRKIEVEFGGKITTPIAIYDLKSGGTLTTLNNNNICPFDRFNFPNLQTYIEFKYGGELDAVAHLVVSDQLAKQTVSIIRKADYSKESLFYSDSGSSIIFEYATSNPQFTSANGAITNIYIKGNVNQGYLNISVATYSINTQNMFLPISYLFNIYILENSSYYTQYKMKFMQGSKVVIMNSASCVLNNEVICYKSDSTSGADGSQYPLTKEDAKFICNGMLTLGTNGKIGAFIETEARDNSAVLDFSNVNDSALNVTSSEGVNSINVNITSSGYFYDENAIDNKEVYQFVSGGITFSSSKGNQTWEGTKNATYNIKVTVEEVQFALKVLSYRIYMADDINGTNKIELTSDVMSTNFDVDVATGKFISIEASRYSTAEFSVIPNGTNYVYSSNTWYEVTGDYVLNIVPNEGISVKISTASKSGAAATTYKIYESSSSNGNFTLIKELVSGGTVVLIKDYYFKIEANFAPLGSYDPTKTSSLDDGKIQVGPTGYVNESIDESTAYPCIGNYEIFFDIKDACLPSGTLITLADGSIKKVEDLTLNDLLLVYNHETGKFEASPIVFIDDDGWKEYDIVNLKFSNGTITRLIYEHGYFDVTLNKYVYVDEYNYRDFIGHQFVYTNGDKLENVTLVDSYITTEYVGCYSPVTAVHLNYIVDGMLSMPGGIEGIFNIFEYGDNLMFDEELMKTDIEKYGIMEYEVLAPYVPYEMYIAFNAKYFNVAIGKGYITFEEILYYAEKYLDRHGLRE